jgi:hypothetical protein
MPAIEIPDSLFARLQKLAVPLVDTPVTVIERLLGSYEVQAGQASPSTGQAESREGRRPQPHSEFEPRTVPSLRHTRILAAEFAGRKAGGWNSLVHVAHVEAVRRLGSMEAVRRISTAKMILGRADSERAKAGYRYVAEINACIQNVDAEHAWSNTFRLAKVLKVPVEVEWLQKSDAAHPGKTARLFWPSFKRYRCCNHKGTRRGPREESYKLVSGARNFRSCDVEALSSCHRSSWRQSLRPWASNSLAISRLRKRLPRVMNPFRQNHRK